MSSTYNGPATLITGGTEIPVNAELRIEAEAEGESGWYGTLASEQPFSADLNRTYDLRFPDTATGAVRVRITASDMANPPDLVDGLAITGEGRAPWLGMSPVDNS